MEMNFNFESETEFLKFIENVREVMAHESDCAISAIDWYKIPLLDSIVSKKQMVEYLIRNSLSGETKSFIVTKHIDGCGELFVVSRATRKTDEDDIRKVMECTNNKIEKEYKKLLNEIN